MKQATKKEKKEGKKIEKEKDKNLFNFHSEKPKRFQGHVLIVNLLMGKQISLGFCQIVT